MNSAALSRDTTGQAEDMQVDMWRRMSPLSKLQAVSALTLGPELAERVFPDSSKLSGY